MPKFAPGSAPSALAFALAVFAVAVANVGSAQPPPDRGQQPWAAVGPQPRPSHVVLRVETAGAHLDEGQLIRIIGPFNPEGDYLVIPLPAGDSAETRRIPSIYWAHRFPMGTTTTTPNVYMLTDVRVRDSKEHQTERMHTVGMQILSAGPDGTPERVVFATPPHQGSLGQHGGVAHLTSN